MDEHHVWIQTRWVGVVFTLNINWSCGIQVGLSSKDDENLFVRAGNGGD